MAYLNVDIPPIECYVRAEYMRQHRDMHGEVFPCLIFGMSSLTGQTPLFHFLMEDGGIWWRMPLSAFCHKREAPTTTLDELLLWDCFSHTVAVTRFTQLVNCHMEYKSRSGQKYSGRYLFTLDWADPDGLGIAELPGQHKCGHFIELEDGNFAVQPNNRILAFSSSFTTKYKQRLLPRLISDRVYSVEQRPTWILSDDASYDYDIKEAAE